jgi:hypothetical protein
MKEKVRVTEESLRSNFTQWIAMAIEKRKEKKFVSGNLVIIIDGIDKYLDSFGREECPDWLPSELPPSVRMIYTCCKSSRAFEHMHSKVDGIIELEPLEIKLKKELYRHICSRYFIIHPLPDLESAVQKNPCCSNPLYLTLFLSFLFANVQGVKKINFKDLDCLGSIEDLMEYVLGYYSGKVFKEEVLARFLKGIVLTRSGISEKELCYITKAKSDVIISLLEVFAPILHNSEGFYIIKNDIVHKLIVKKINIPNETLHQDLISVLDDHKFTIRKIDELSYSLCEIKNWMKLKDFLTKLEVFAIMYSPAYKIELCMYWLKLEQQHFDPVQEYNRALEEFVAVYSPNNKDLFILLIQFCRFFKDLAEVESSYTSMFRHPKFRGYYELKDINMLDEIENLQLFDKTAGKFNFFDGSLDRDQIREKIFNDEDKFNTPEFYYYKRWVWIQFPWCAIDINSNFSESMKHFTYLSDKVSVRDELNIFLNIINLVNAIKKSEDSRIRGSSLNSSLSKIKKTQSSTKISRGLCILPEIKAQTVLMPNVDDEIKISNNKYLSSSLSLAYFDDKEYSQDISFKDLTPGNIIEKIGIQVKNYTYHELFSKKKETFNLQKLYNKLREDLRQKSLKLEAIQSQIENSMKKIKEQQEVKDKAVIAENQIEKIFDKHHKAEEEGKRLRKIVTCCIKNPTRNDQWEKGLEKTLETIKDFIRLESELIKSYKKETVIYEEESKNFQNLKSERKKVQNSTLMRVAEQLQIKSNIKSNIKNNKKNRINIIHKYKVPKFSDNSKAVIEKYENLMLKIKKFKNTAKLKLKGYQEMVEKVSVFRNFEDAYSLYDILNTFDRHNQLKDEIATSKNKIKEITREKEALQLQLNFLREKRIKEKEKPSKYNTFDEISFFEYTNHKKIEQLRDFISSQEILISKFKVFLENCWEKLIITTPITPDIIQNLKIIHTRILQIENLSKTAAEPSKETKAIPQSKPRSASGLSEDFTYKSTDADFFQDKKHSRVLICDERK